MFFRKMLYVYLFVFTSIVYAADDDTVKDAEQDKQTAVTNKEAELEVSKVDLDDTQSLINALIELEKQLKEQSIILENMDLKIGEIQKVQGVLVNKSRGVNEENKRQDEKAQKEADAKKEDNKINGKVILGADEWGFIEKSKVNLRARVDTGAAVSSISATDVKQFERDGEKWIRFSIETHSDDKSDDEKDVIKVVVEEPIVRWSRVRQSSSEEVIKRPVIRTWVRVGPIRVNTELTLTDRTHMTYPLLLGRSFFKDIAIVDVAKSYIYEKIDLTANQESLDQKK